jgi:hypothetical protein
MTTKGVARPASISGSAALHHLGERSSTYCARSAGVAELLAGELEKG